MKKGRVIWFNEFKGYGFIEDSNGEKYLTHYTELCKKTNGTGKLTPGTMVSFHESSSDTNIGSYIVKGRATKVKEL